MVQIPFQKSDQFNIDRSFDSIKSRDSAEWAIETGARLSWQTKRTRKGVRKRCISFSSPTAPDNFSYRREVHSKVIGDLLVRISSLRGFGSRSAFGVRGIKLIADGIPVTMPDGQRQAASFNLDLA
jgi:hypothetical protein